VAIARKKPGCGKKVCVGSGGQAKGEKGGGEECPHGRNWKKRGGKGGPQISCRGQGCIGENKRAPPGPEKWFLQRKRGKKKRFGLPKGVREKKRKWSLHRWGKRSFHVRESNNCFAQ